MGRNMILKFCTRCKQPFPFCTSSLCPDCRSKRQINYNRFERDKKTDQFYHSKKWKQLSKSILARANYKCAICGGLAVEVHHIKEIRTDWDKRFDPDNLMPLCTACHNAQR